MTNIIAVRFQDEQEKEITSYMENKRRAFPSRSACVRELVDRGLNAEREKIRSKEIGFTKSAQAIINFGAVVLLGTCFITLLVIPQVFVNAITLSVFGAGLFFFTCVFSANFFFIIKEVVNEW
tara:strand:+ start:2920 stop:3288 length:369 start_codon:yes stop_codon:yes gene_type:complete